MVTKMMYAVVAVVLVITACNNQSKGVSALNDPQQQEAVLDSIAANPALLQKVNAKAQNKGTSGSMNEMSGMSDMGGMNMGDSSMAGMMNNPQMMNKMMTMMMQQCEKDTAMCRQMCTKMMDNPRMMEMMRGMMNRKGTDTSGGNMKMNHY